jgi:hypothetical protein
MTKEWMPLGVFGNLMIFVHKIHSAKPIK